MSENCCIKHILEESDAHVNWNKNTSLPKNSSRYVIAIQAALELLGYKNSGHIDGLYGAQTKAQVLAYQAANGLQQDGAMGPITLSKMLEQLKNTTTEPPTQPINTIKTQLHIPINTDMMSMDILKKKVIGYDTNVFTRLDYVSVDALNGSNIWSVIDSTSCVHDMQITCQIKLTTVFGNTEWYAIDKNNNVYKAVENPIDSVDYGYKYTNEYVIKNKKIVKTAIQAY